MAAEKVKMFFGNMVEDIEPQINKWLASLKPTTEVRRSETAAAIQHAQDKASPMIVVSVWYIEASN